MEVRDGVETVAIGGGEGKGVLLSYFSGGMESIEIYLQITSNTLKTRDEQKLQVPELGTGTATELAVLELELPQASPVSILIIRELPSAIPVPILIIYGTANCRDVSLQTVAEPL
ncbi:hypothetical protein LXL04_014620 [Taraxacum kok-saghyz]